MLLADLFDVTQDQYFIYSMSKFKSDIFNPKFSMDYLIYLPISCMYHV